MLRADATKLRWVGINIRPRWRRRVAVVATYAAFLAVVWLQPRWMGKVFVVMKAMPKLKRQVGKFCL
jgi:hypothetical protein